MKIDPINAAKAGLVIGSGLGGVGALYAIPYGTVADNLATYYTVIRPARRLAFELGLTGGGLVGTLAGHSIATKLNKISSLRKAANKEDEMSRTKLAYAIHESFAKKANAVSTGASRLQKALMASGLLGTAGLGVKAHSLANQLAESGAALGAAESKNIGLGAQVAALTNNLGVKGDLLQRAISANDQNVSSIKNILNPLIKKLVGQVNQLNATHQMNISYIEGLLQEIGRLKNPG